MDRFFSNCAPSKLRFGVLYQIAFAVSAFTCAAFASNTPCLAAMQNEQINQQDEAGMQVPIRNKDQALQFLQAQQNPTSGQNSKLQSDVRLSQLFGDVNQIDNLPTQRRPLALSPGANAIFAAEATGRRTADIGSLLKESKSSQGISIQRRTPIISDTRVRGQRVGQVLASGSYWAPARMDLDTMMNKIDSRLIDDVIVVKGPYAAQYGPGFRFVDMEFKKSPRYSGGFHTHGSTSFSYNTNGQQFYGRQTIQGADDDFGFLLSYGMQTGNDYKAGQNGFTLPTSYKSGDLFGAIGWDLSDHQSIEINVLRLDQNDLEFPGLVYDINFLVTDGYELTYTDESPWFADHFVAEVWYNRTRFEGDTLRPGKNLQIPQLELQLESVSGFDGFAITDGDALSGGYRFASTYNTNHGQVTFGTDLILLNQELNDIEPIAPANDNNFPIPRSKSIDVGLFVESVEQITPQLTRTAGARIDGVFTDSQEFVQGVPVSLAILKDSELDQEFLLGSAFLTMEYQVTPQYQIKAGIGTSHRPPTLTELYAESTFIGSLQQGLTFLGGDPQLNSEKLYQIDLGSHFQSDNLSWGVNGYHAWINDYITYDLSDPAGVVDGFQVGAEFVNTDLATLVGLEAYGQYKATDMLTFFGILSVMEGRDHTRRDPARLTGLADRSDIAGVEKEPLPGINPTEARLGFLIQDPCPRPQWGIEFMARIVDNQDRIAETLAELETPGFSTLNIRTFRRFGRLLVTSGVENLTDRFYREHIDYRSGLGVFQPGVGFYFGTELTY